MGSTSDPEDGPGVARTCYTAAFGYVALGLFGISQVWGTHHVVWKFALRTLTWVSVNPLLPT